MTQDERKLEWTDSSGNVAFTTNTHMQTITMQTITLPRSGKWTAHMFGGYVQFTPNEGQEPNAFHRLMQRLAFGVVWKRDTTTKGRELDNSTHDKRE